MTREVMQLALEALENGKNVRAFEGGTKFQEPLENAAIAKIKEALAQPQFRSSGNTAQNAAATKSISEIQKRQWVGLTGEEVDNIVAYPWGETKNWVRAVEAALKKKNL